MNSQPRILMVDDEPNVLSGYRRTLCESYDVSTADGGAAALKILDESGPFPVVFTDMRMPRMDGVAFLRGARKKHPDSVYVMLTGNSDQETAINAINEGQVFRFLNKPCSPEMLEHTIRAGLRHYELIQSEKVLLRDTLSGSVKLLVEAMTLSHPELGKMGGDIRHDSQVLSNALGLSADWRLPLAASLCLLGFLVVSEASNGESLSDEVLESCAESGAGLLRHIPRLDEVAQVVARQREPGHLPNEFTATDGVTRAAVGARILRFVVDLQRETRAKNGDQVAALNSLRLQPKLYDSRILDAASGSFDQLSAARAAQASRIRICVPVRALKPGMDLDQDILTTDGMLLLSKGQTLAPIMVERLRRFSRANLEHDEIAVITDAPGENGEALAA